MSETTNPYSWGSFKNFISNNFIIIIILTIFLIVGFLSGSLWTENKMLKTGSADSPADVVPREAAQPQAPSGPSETQLSKVPQISKDDHVRGGANPKITLFEYSDFECPFCNRFHPTMMQIVEEYGDDVAWVYRHYPLGFHPLAQKAAEASECVAKLGGNDAFWEYADILFENMSDGKPDALAEESLLAAATSAGVSSQQVKSCLDSDEMAEKVKAQSQAGGAAGVSGTPGTIIVTQDGQYDFIPGALPLPQVKEMLDQYL